MTSKLLERSTMLTAIYTPADPTEARTRNAERVIIGSVVESGWKHLSNIYSVRCDDGSYVAFDVREIAQFSGVFDGVSFARQQRLNALTRQIGRVFDSRAEFMATMLAAGERMAVVAPDDVAT
ncbi:hypothetical protein [Paraburkholderia sp. SIMBA_054]|uniref:hypothetical protein n=1 Tax=Paraburkholderia sp. SIMBA_054 TaxID=3085795 RepID=UPI00397813ED